MRFKHLMIAAVAVLALGACNKEAGAEQSTPATVSAVTPFPELGNISEVDAVKVEAKVKSEFGLHSVWINYCLDGDQKTTKSIDPYYYSGEASTSVTYTGTIPVQKAGVKVSFQVIAATPYGVVSGSEILDYIVKEVPQPLE